MENNMSIVMLTIFDKILPTPKALHIQLFFIGIQTS